MCEAGAGHGHQEPRLSRLSEETLDWLTPEHRVGAELLPKGSPSLETQGARAPVYPRGGPGGSCQTMSSGEPGGPAPWGQLPCRLARVRVKAGMEERVCVHGLSDRGGGKKEGCL